jgi:hypothetical protein
MRANLLYLCHSFVYSLVAQLHAAKTGKTRTLLYLQADIISRQWIAVFLGNLLGGKPYNAAQRKRWQTEAKANQ